MKRIHLFGMGLGSAALLVAGAALADPPSGHSWNDWEALGGIITVQPDGVGGSNCTPPACVVLLNEVGMTQVRVRDLGGDGYFQTINIEDSFTGPASAAEFRNESFVGATNQAGGFDMAALNYVDLSGEGLMQVELASGALQDTANNEAGFVIYQTNTLTGFGNVAFSFEKQPITGAPFPTATTSGSSLRIDYNVNNVAGDRGTPFTVRQTSGFYTGAAGTLTNVDGSTVTYNAGDHIGVVYMAGLLWHGGPMHMPDNTNRVFEVYNLQNFTNPQLSRWTSTVNEIDDTGIGYVSFQGAWQDANVGDAIWDPAGPFGSTPASVASFPAAPNFAVLNAASNPFPDFPDHTP